jgi:hypothetical protein
MVQQGLTLYNDYSKTYLYNVRHLILKFSYFRLNWYNSKNIRGYTERRTFFLLEMQSILHNLQLLHEQFKIYLKTEWNNNSEIIEVQPLDSSCR